VPCKPRMPQFTEAGIDVIHGCPYHACYFSKVGRGVIPYITGGCDPGCREIHPFEDRCNREHLGPPAEDDAPPIRGCDPGGNGDHRIPAATDDIEGGTVIAFLY